MPPRPLRFVTFLAPNMFSVYEFITAYVGRRLGIPVELAVGSSYDELDGGVDVAFVCGLPYVELTRQAAPPVEPLVAPVLSEERYGGRPVYFSDVVVHRDSRYQTFADLRGCTWVYNEPHSQSGHGIARYHLRQLGECDGFFGRMIESGWHERSLRMVSSGEADASAIDSHVLAMERRRDPELIASLRVIETLGPSTIQPVVAARKLPERLRQELRRVLIEMADDPEARAHLAHGLVDRFVAVTDSSYDDIREMLAAVDSSQFAGKTADSTTSPYTGDSVHSSLAVHRGEHPVFAKSKNASAPGRP